MATLLIGIFLIIPLSIQALVFESTREGQGTVSIEGTSTLHDWEVKGEDIRGSLEIAADVIDLATADALFNTPIQATVQIPVRSLTSDNRGMDRRMFSAMNESDHANVTFVLSELQPLPEKIDTLDLAAFASEGTLIVMASGKLTISGKTNDILFPASFHWDGSQLTIAVEVTLMMSDYGVEPPRALMGTIRTGDEVVIRAKWSPIIAE